MGALWLSPSVYLLAISYFLLTATLNFGLTLSLDHGLYGVGALIGLHLLELVERITNVSRDVFRTVVVYGFLTIATFYVLTSTSWSLGKGVVLFLNLRYVFLHYQDYFHHRTLASWFKPVGVRLPPAFERYYLYGVLLVFILQTVLFMFV